MGCCSSRQEFERAIADDQEDAEHYPLPVINPTEKTTPTIFDPEFRPNQSQETSAKAESLMDEDGVVVIDSVPEARKRVDDKSDSSSSVDQDMIKKLLAEVDTSDLSD